MIMMMIITPLSQEQLALMERIRSLAQQQQITPALPSSGAAAVRAEVRLMQQLQHYFISSGIMPSNMYGRYIRI